MDTQGVFFNSANRNIMLQKRVILLKITRLIIDSALKEKSKMFTLQLTRLMMPDAL